MVAATTWFVKKVIDMPKDYATKEELKQLADELKDDIHETRVKMDEIGRAVMQIGTMAEVISRVEREIGTHDTGLRGAVHRLMDQHGSMLRTIQTKLAEIGEK